MDKERFAKQIAFILEADKEKEIYGKYADCTTEMHDLTEREAFIKGFALGARIIIEVMTTKEVDE